MIGSYIVDAADGGAMGIRTPDLLNAIEALYQLSYDPLFLFFQKTEPATQTYEQ